MWKEMHLVFFVLNIWVELIYPAKVYPSITDFRDIGTLDIVSANGQPMYVTVKYCLKCYNIVALKIFAK